MTKDATVLSSLLLCPYIQGCGAINAGEAHDMTFTDNYVLISAIQMMVALLLLLVVVVKL